MIPFDKCTPFQHLKALRLHKINLRHAADTYCRVVDFTRIQYLRLFHCPGSETLFGELSKSTRLPAKLLCLEFQHKDNAENDALDALDGFLCLVPGIKDMVIDIENVKQMPASAGICRHGKTLESLNVHAWGGDTDGDSDELVWEVSDFEKICRAATRLEQMSCAWPATSLIRSPSEAWVGFETAIAHLNDLITLNITTWPNNKPSSNFLPRVVYEHLLQSLAQRAFDRTATSTSTSNSTSPSSTFPPAPTPNLLIVPILALAPLPPPPPAITPTAANNANDNNTAATWPASSSSNLSLSTPHTASTTKTHKLRLVAFGTSDKIYERTDSLNQSIWLRSSCDDAEGRRRNCAVPIGWCARQYVEPRSEVLEFVLGRGGRMPVREWERVEDGE
ncbi:hypothetical protein LTR28_014079 [Elasticomyces elasticus]|nr:hypothetical protein LTR28_014079 [Elasticomyces elasticus]